MRKRFFTKGVIPLIPLIIVGTVMVVTAVAAILSTTQLAKRRQTTSTQAADAACTFDSALLCAAACNVFVDGVCQNCPNTIPAKWKCVVPLTKTPTPRPIPRPAETCEIGVPIGSCCSNSRKCAKDSSGGVDCIGSSCTARTCTGGVAIGS